ncbi:MAG: hypothetical protein RIR62_1418 [Pseudomonadota bacterium]
MTGTGNGMRWVTGCFGLMLAMGAGAAGARGLPPHDVRFDPVAGQCHVLLQPADTTGETPPRLRLSAGMTEEEDFALAIDGVQAVEAVLVRRGERLPFLPRAGMTAAALLEDPVWSQLAAPPPPADLPPADAPEATAAPAEGGAVAAAAPAVPDSLFLTVKDAGGRYSSSRYDGLTREDVLRLLRLACGARGIAAPALTVVEHRAAEAALDLTDADRLALRRLLAARYGSDGTDVGDGVRFTVTDRRHIQQLNTEAGHPSGDYLWPEAVPALLEEAAAQAPAEAPAEAGAMAAGETLISRHGDWAVTGAGAVCRSATVAVGAEGLAPGLRMEFAVDRSGRGGMMAIDLVKPNPFRADMPLVASVDGQGYALVVEPSSGAVIPRPQPDGSMTRDVTVALRRGASVVIEGVSAVTGAPARVAFSAKGFSAAFAAMAQACDRAAVMGWIE